MPSLRCPRTDDTRGFAVRGLLSHGRWATAASKPLLSSARRLSPSQCDRLEAGAYVLPAGASDAAGGERAAGPLHGVLHRAPVATARTALCTGDAHRHGTPEPPLSEPEGGNRFVKARGLRGQQLCPGLGAAWCGRAASPSGGGWCPDACASCPPAASSGRLSCTEGSPGLSDGWDPAQPAPRPCHSPFH